MPSIAGRSGGGLASRENSSEKQQNQVPTADAWLVKSPEVRDKNLTEAFEVTQDKLDSDSKTDVMFSGTTCVYCFLSNNHSVCANSGDSRAMLCSLINNKWTTTQLSRDHKPEEVDEAARVRRCNGRIEQSRLQPGMVVPGLRTQAGMFYGPKRVWLKNK